jgi:hypothetical protein
VRRRGCNARRCGLEPSKIGVETPLELPGP